MAKKNKKTKNPAPVQSTEGTSSSSQVCSKPPVCQGSVSQNIQVDPSNKQNKQAKSKETPPSNLASTSTNQKNQTNKSNSQNKVVSGDSSSQNNQAKKKGKTGANPKANTQTNLKNPKGKPGIKKAAPVKAKAAPPKANPRPPIERYLIKVPKTTHAPAENRLKCLILFKQECAVYIPENVRATMFDYYFKRSRRDDPGRMDLDVFNCVDELVSKEKENVILDTITTLLDKNNPLLINYECVLIILAKCLHLVRQDPKAKLPSPSIIEFRTKALALAMDRVCTTCSKRFLQFVFCLYGYSEKLLNASLLRNALSKWYTDKEPEQLLLLVSRCSFYRGLGHGAVMKMIHFNFAQYNKSPDKLFALYTTGFGFEAVVHRLTFGSFSSKLRLPSHVSASLCFDQAEEKLKTIVKEVTVARSPASFQKLVAGVVRSHKLSIDNVASAFFRSYKINAACLENMSQRQLLRDMHRLRLHAILSAAASARVADDDVTTCGLYVRLLLQDAAPAEPPLHPAEVLAAYLEYAVAPSVAVDQFRVYYERCKLKEEEGGAGGDQQSLPPVQDARTPDPAVTAALSSLYEKSFQNIKPRSLNIIVCIDFQLGTESCRNYDPLPASLLSMLLLKSLQRMVEKPSNLQVMGFKEKTHKPVYKLKLLGNRKSPEVPAETEEELVASVEEEPCLEEVADIGSEEEEGEEGGGGGETPAEGADVLQQLKDMWTHYKEQVPRARGITYHKLLSHTSRQHKVFSPDAIVVICLQRNLSLFQSHIAFNKFAEVTKKENFKLITVSPHSHIKNCRLIHRKNMLHFVGFDQNITHVISDFLDDKI